MLAGPRTRAERYRVRSVIQSLDGSWTAKRSRVALSRKSEPFPPVAAVSRRPKYKQAGGAKPIAGSTLRPLISAGSCCRARHSVLATNNVCFGRTGPVSGLSESKTRTPEGIALRLESRRNPIKHRYSRAEREESFEPTLFRNTPNDLRKPAICVEKGVEQLGFANLAASLTSQGVFSRRQ